MPLINPIWRATLRSYWPLVGAIFVFAVLSISDQVWFRPTAKRYQTALKQAAELGIPVDPVNVPPVLPPRLFALLSDNSLPAAAAQEQSNSGALTAQLLEDMSELIGRHGMRVLSTEPGPISQQPNAVQLHAHLRLRCRYPDFLTLLDDITQSGKLLAVDRFTMTPDGTGGEFLDLWVSRYVIKQDTPGK